MTMSRSLMKGVCFGVSLGLFGVASSMGSGKKTSSTDIQKRNQAPNINIGGMIIQVHQVTENQILEYLQQSKSFIGKAEGYAGSMYNPVLLRGCISEAIRDFLKSKGINLNEKTVINYSNDNGKKTIPQPYQQERPYSGSYTSTCKPSSITDYIDDLTKRIESAVSKEGTTNSGNQKIKSALNKLLGRGSLYF